MADHLPSNPNPLTTPTRAAETLAALYDQLATTTNLVDLDNIQKRADALHHMAGLAKLHRQWQNRFFGLRVHALCRWGEIYAATEKNKGGDPLLIAEGGQTLAEMGVSYNFSSECQRLSRIPKEVLHAYLAAGEAADDDSEVAELSKAGLFAFAKAAAEPAPITPEPPNPADGVTVSPEPPTPEPPKPEPEPEVGDTRIIGYTKDPTLGSGAQIVAPDHPSAEFWCVSSFAALLAEPLWRESAFIGTSLADAKSHEEQLRSLTPALKQMAQAPQPKHRDLRIVGTASFDRNLPLPSDHPAATEWNIHRYYASAAGPGPMWNSVRDQGVVVLYHTLAAAQAALAEMQQRKQPTPEGIDAEIIFGITAVIDNEPKVKASKHMEGFRFEAQWQIPGLKVEATLDAHYKHVGVDENRVTKVLADEICTFCEKFDDLQCTRNPETGTITVWGYKGGPDGECLGQDDSNDEADYFEIDFWDDITAMWRTLGGLHDADRAEEFADKIQAKGFTEWAEAESFAEELLREMADAAADERGLPAKHSGDPDAGRDRIAELEAENEALKEHIRLAATSAAFYEEWFTKAVKVLRDLISTGGIGVHKEAESFILNVDPEFARQIRPKTVWVVRLDDEKDDYAVFALEQAAKDHAADYHSHSENACPIYEEPASNFALAGCKILADGEYLQDFSEVPARVASDPLPELVEQTAAQ